ncbi:hypothetical protein E2C01_049330 [Portunus trituberculatus]|uniref:Uncharacterized protein n=1 Tax=Portunus trituberculatus TaxID=210409 RepID=A0A5B7GDE7_PORTR|nr:hypothetical protein [Portunus trituberculatus]
MTGRTLSRPCLQRAREVMAMEISTPRIHQRHGRRWTWGGWRRGGGASEGRDASCRHTPTRAWEYAPPASLRPAHTPTSNHHAVLCPVGVSEQRRGKVEAVAMADCGSIAGVSHATPPRHTTPRLTSPRQEEPHDSTLMTTRLPG